MSRIRTWKRLGILALLGLMLGLVISCRPTASPSKSPEIEFWTMQLQPKFTDYFNQLITQFEAENPGVKVRGVELVDAQGKAAFNTPKGKAAFQYWVDFYQQGLMPKEALTQGHRRAIELYQAGETALLSSGAEFMDTIAKNAPSVAKASAAAPQITGDTGKKNVAVMNIVIPRDTNNPDAALKFALFVTNTENQLAFAKAANVLPSTLEALQQYRRSLTSDGKALPVEQARDISASQMEQAQVLIPTMKNLNRLQKAIYENLQAAMLGEKTVDQAVTDAEQEWNSNLS
jgi:putative chitobiose transport system substrate-binding protein